MDIYRQPWSLVPNHVRAEGGREIDRFRGVPDPKDVPDGAEAWIGSVTRANGVTKENPNLGCSEVILPDHSKHYLFDVIREHPAEVLGTRHLERFGTELGVLVKYLDAKKKFLLQCHPTREKARELWNSDYGKTECWHVISVRDDVEEPPFIWLGFKKDITPEKFAQAYRSGNLEAVENLCHRFPVHAGETYFIPGGMPHALGVGCFVVEIQEPTDLTAVPISQQALIDFRKKANPKGVFTRIDDVLYDSRTLGSFDYTGRAPEEILRMTKSQNRVIRSGEWGEERLIIGPEQTAFFACTEITVRGKAVLPVTGEIRIGIVTDGSGSLRAGNSEFSCRRGSEIFFPIGADRVTAEGNMTLVLCHPGGAAVEPKKA